MNIRYKGTKRAFGNHLDFFNLLQMLGSTQEAATLDWPCSAVVMSGAVMGGGGRNFRSLMEAAVVCTAGVYSSPNKS
jgi:hypothetical protein